MCSTDSQVTTLTELAAKCVASFIPFELVEHFVPPVPEQLQMRIAFWSFPDNEEDIRLYSCLANSSSDEFHRGDQLYRNRSVKEPLQIGKKLLYFCTFHSLEKLQLGELQLRKLQLEKHQLRFFLLAHKKEEWNLNYSLDFRISFVGDCHWNAAANSVQCSCHFRSEANLIMQLHVFFSSILVFARRGCLLASYSLRMFTKKHSHFGEN